MSTTVAPERARDTVKPATVTTGPLHTVDREAMITAQIAEVEAFLVKHPNAIRPGFRTVREYVERVFDRHQHHITRAGGWRWHSVPLGPLPVSSATLQKAITEVTSAFEKGITLYENHREKKPVKLEPLKLMRHETPADALYCETLKCHLPYPAFSHEMWRTAVFQPEGDLKEVSLPYAGQHEVKIRAGQRITKPLLAEVRKTFKDFPVYISLWEALCEKMGVVWASAKGAALTISVAPVDFLRLGHYGEGSSCYATAGGSEYSKLTLSLVPDSAVWIFYPEAETTPPDAQTLRAQVPNGRCWSIFDYTTQSVMLSNLYLLGFPQIMPSIHAAVKALCGWTTKDAPYSNPKSGIEPLTGEARMYVNGDTRYIAANPPEVAAGVKQIQTQCQLINTEKEAHSKLPCDAGCGKYYGRSAAFVKGRCGHSACPTCAAPAPCCGQATCGVCTKRGKGMLTCKGCGAKACGNCPDNVYIKATDTNDDYCAKCAAKTLTPCSLDATHIVVTPTRAKDGTPFCAGCAARTLRECDRCHAKVTLDHVTRCGGCEKRRCDDCLAEGESAEPRSLCAACTAAGTPAKPAVPSLRDDPDFQASVAALPADIRTAYIEALDRFEAALR